MPSNFLPKIFSLTGHVKTEKLICKSIVYVQCSRLEARILLPFAAACRCIQVYRKQILLCYWRLIPIFTLMNKSINGIYLFVERKIIFHESLK